MNPYRDILTLDHDPKLAAALGSTLVAWAHAETGLVLALSRITGIPRNSATQAYYRIPTFESRIKFLRSLLSTWHNPEFDREKIDRAILKLSGLSRTRNHWVHGAWSKSQISNETVVFDFRSDPNAPERRKPVKASDVTNHVEAGNRWASDLLVKLQTLP